MPNTNVHNRFLKMSSHAWGVTLKKRWNILSSVNFSVFILHDFFEHHLITRSRSVETCYIIQWEKKPKKNPGIQLLINKLGILFQIVERYMYISILQKKKRSQRAGEKKCSQTADGSAEEYLESLTFCGLRKVSNYLLVFSFISLILEQLKSGWCAKWSKKYSSHDNGFRKRVVPHLAWKDEPTFSLPFYGSLQKMLLLQIC